MKNYQVDRLIEPAIALVEKYFGKEKPVPKGYESALASFGGTLIQSGPLPACALYLKTSDSNIDKARLIRMLMELMKEQGGFSMVVLAEKSNDLMKQIIQEYNQNEELFKHRLVNATIALKLALRTFELTREEA